MDHILFLLSVFAVFIGTGSALLNLLLFFKYKSFLFKYLFFYSLPFHLLFMLECLRQYILLNVNQAFSGSGFSVLSILIISLSLFVQPFYSQKIIARSLNTKQIIAYLCTVPAVLFLGFYRFFDNDHIQRIIIFTVFLIISTVIAVRILMHIRDVAIKSLRIFFMVFSTLIFLSMLIWTPYSIIQLTFLSDLPVQNPRLFIIIIYTVSFLVLCIIQFLYFIHYTPPVSFSLSRSFVKKYRITEREKDIILLLQEGYTSKSIAERLYLSHQTIKNYSYKIYKKAGVGNKIELLNVIKDS